MRRYFGWGRRNTAFSAPPTLAAEAVLREVVWAPTEAGFKVEIILDVAATGWR